MSYDHLSIVQNYAPNNVDDGDVDGNGKDFDVDYDALEGYDDDVDGEDDVDYEALDGDDADVDVEDYCSDYVDRWPDSKNAFA